MLFSGLLTWSVKLIYGVYCDVVYSICLMPFPIYFCCRLVYFGILRFLAWVIFETCCLISCITWYSLITTCVSLHYNTLLLCVTCLDMYDVHEKAVILYWTNRY